MRQRHDMKAVLAAIASLVVWSSAFAGMSQVVTKGGYGAGQAALLRFLVASATMGVVAIATRMRLPAREDLPGIALAALFGITMYHLCFTFGETQVSAGAAALIIASGPIWTALLAVAFLGERLNRWGWAGVALAFGGVAAISFTAGGDWHFQPMALVVLLGAMATAVYFVLSKKPLRKYSSLAFTSYVIWIGTVPLLVFLPGLVHQLPLAPAWSTWTLIYLGVFPAAGAYWLWSYALARMPATTTASYLYAQPVLAMLMSWAWQGVVPGVVTLGGGALALIGVVLVQTKGRPSPRIGISVARTPEERAAARELAEETIANMAERLALPDTHFEDERAHFDEWYGGERGRSLLATVEGRPAGVVVIRDVGDGTAELRRMYVRPAYRRRGLARALVRSVVEEARKLGYRRVLLMTSDEFEGAAPLYESEGFTRVPPYREASARASVAFALEL